MVVLANKAKTLEKAHEMLFQVIDNGKALAKFGEMIEAQGGNKAILDDYSLLPRAKYQFEITAPKSGYIQKMTADELDVASMLLGGGRQSKEDTINYAVGLRLHKKLGEQVKDGEKLVTVYSDQENISRVKDLILIS